MDRGIVVLDADQKQCRQLCGLLENWRYRVKPMFSWSDLEGEGGIEDTAAVLIDIDSVPVDNRLIRNLKCNSPETQVLLISKDRFHPELKDAISRHVYVCLKRPLDFEELFFWLKTIWRDEKDEADSTVYC